jgi:hypothetical protein
MAKGMTSSAVYRERAEECQRNARSAAYSCPLVLLMLSKPAPELELLQPDASA